MPRRRPHLLPVVIVAASLLLCIKLADLWSDGGAAIATALAADAKSAAPSSPAAAATAPPAQPPATAQSGDAPPNAAPPGNAQPASDPAASASAAPTPKPPRDPLQMTPEEIGELQQLAERRTELERHVAELSEREVLMQATEKRIDEKIAKLDTLQKSIDASVKVQDDRDEARLQSLAHMYEQMKPAEASRILDQLDVPVILTMLTHMREMKASPILATMDPGKAKLVTLALAEHRKSPTAPPSADDGKPSN